MAASFSLTFMISSGRVRFKVLHEVKVRAQRSFSPKNHVTSADGGALSQPGATPREGGQIRTRGLKARPIDGADFQPLFLLSQSPGALPRAEIAWAVGPFPSEPRSQWSPRKTLNRTPSGSLIGMAPVYFDSRGFT